MTLPIRIKQPGETRTLTFDFTDKLATGDLLTGTPVVTAATGLTAGAPALGADSRTVDVPISGGTDAVDYNVQCKCDTVNGDVLQLDATVQVREQNNG